ncbi:hypothetical protein EVAR_81417_1 [Eumeta japonica]|uniref:Uncharacterized protein n=1 Tax=Eumeta variegata TaxID=151549 RepID=A0A4C1WI40_EUMVA|nr:hypothetical protein EVAR_81417_1 [Eumeta japonica]
MNSIDETMKKTIDVTEAREICEDRAWDGLRSNTVRALQLDVKLREREPLQMTKEITHFVGKSPLKINRPFENLAIIAFVLYVTDPRLREING